MLWETPPATLTPSCPNPIIFFTKTITIKLRVAPARLYIILEPLPNIKPIIKILTMETSAASFHVYLSSTKSTARFASPSFIPGIPAKNGINDSTYPKIMAMAANSPRYAAFF